MIEKIKLYISEFGKLMRFNLSANNHFLFIAFYEYFYYPKPRSLNAFLNEYSLSKKYDFTVIQIGANDGITSDPIHKFIKRDGWKGVLFEPQSYVYKNFLKKIYRLNEGIHPLNAAIGYENGSQTLYKIGFCDMRWATGLASFNRSNVEKAFINGLVAKKCAKYGISIPAEPEHITSEEVSVLSPRSIYEKYTISKIDLLQIDVEGFDYEIIKIFDIAKSQPKAIIFEHSHLSVDDYEECWNHLLENNYFAKKFGPNTLAMLEPNENFMKYFE